MLVYHAAYKHEEGVILGEFLDFPGTISCGQSLSDARENLASALHDMAETNLSRGEALPVPKGDAVDPDADLNEPIYLVLQTGYRFHVEARIRDDHGLAERSPAHRA